MTSDIRGPVVIDTGVFAARLTPSGKASVSGGRSPCRPGLELVTID